MAPVAVVADTVVDAVFVGVYEAAALVSSAGASVVPSAAVSA